MDRNNYVLLSWSWASDHNAASKFAFIYLLWNLNERANVHIFISIYPTFNIPSMRQFYLFWRFFFCTPWQGESVKDLQIWQTTTHPVEFTHKFWVILPQLNTITSFISSDEMSVKSTYCNFQNSIACNFGETIKW